MEHVISFVVQFDIKCTILELEGVRGGGRRKERRRIELFIVIQLVEDFAHEI